jgi:hypothetical protein
MINKSLKFFLYIFIFFLIILISYFTFDFDLRRKILTYTFVTHDYYQIKRLTSDLQSRNFKNISSKIENYINISKKFSVEKSYMLPGIYEALELAVSRTVEQEDYNYLEKSLSELVNMDQKLYKPKVWLARALSDNDFDKSIYLLEKAISLSPTQEDAYREIIRISYIYNNFNLAKKYCELYQVSQIGGNQDNNFGSLFGSYNLKKFALKFINENSDNYYYYNSGVQLGKFYDYEFIPKVPLNLNGLNLYFSFLPGIEIQIKDIIIFSNNQQMKITPKEIMFSSKSSYLYNDKEAISFYSLKEAEDIVRLDFIDSNFALKSKTFKSVDKLIISLKFKKMMLTNKVICN